ncbi:SGNH/GDSL hydrolase family protein [Nocardia salmonicida]
MKTSLTVVGLTIGAVVVASAALVSASPAQHAPPVRYVSLGDSFSAAAGVLPLVDDAPLSCTRSQRNYAHIIAERRGYALTDVSCAGAETVDLYQEQEPGIPPQLAALTNDTDLVTLTLGGNDRGVFGTAATECTRAMVELPHDANPCQARFGDSFVESIRTVIYPDLVRALADIHTAAPNARVLIAGYLWLVPESGPCFPQIPIAADDVAYLREIQAVLNDAVERAATATDSIYVDMSVRSDGRDACQLRERRLAEPVLLPTQFMPLHPNSEGQQAIAEEFLNSIDR